MALTLSVLTRKGGVGRTTTVTAISSVWAKEGARVLLVDLDSQASLSRCLLGSEFVESTHASETVAGVFDERYDVEPEDVIHPTEFEGLSLLPACDALEEHNVTKPWLLERHQQTVLRDFLKDAEELFDVVLIDTAPNTVGLTAWAALAASNFVMSPVLCDSFSTQSIISVQRLVEQVQMKVNPELEILGYFINMRQKNAVMNAYEETLRKVHGSMVFDTVLPLAAQYRQAIAERTPLAFKKGKAKAILTMFDFAQEINDRICATANKRKAA